MNGRLPPVVLVALLLATGFSTPSTAHPAGGLNLLHNPGFEADEDQDHAADGWQPFHHPDTVLLRTPVRPHGGAWALDVVDAAEFFFAGVRSDVVAVRPGDHLSLDGWSFYVHQSPSVVFSPPLRALVGVEFVYPGSFSPDVSVPIPLVIGGWAAFHADLIVPWGVTEVRVVVMTNGPGALRLDDFSLRVVEPDGNHLPNPGFETGALWDTTDLWWGDCGFGETSPRSRYAVEGWYSYRLEREWNQMCAAVLSEVFVLSPGAYRLTGQRDHRGVGSAAAVLLYDHDGGPFQTNPIGYGQIEFSTVTQGWERFTLDLCAPAETAKGMVFLTSPSSGAAYYDGLRLERIGECPA